MAMTRKERQDFKDARERKGEEAVREAYDRGEYGEWEAPLAERRLWAERYLEPFDAARASGGEAKWIARLREGRVVGSEPKSQRIVCKEIPHK